MSGRIVGLVVAMSAEARALTGRAQPRAQVVRLGEYACLRVGGVGAGAAERSCAALMQAGAGALVSVGCAAGLVPDVRPGALVLPAEMRSARGEVYPADAEWRAALLEGLKNQINPLHGHIVGVDRVIGSAEKRALHQRTGAVAADMESVIVAQAARRRGLPVIALRVVSDAADDDVPDALLDTIDEFGRPRYGTLTGALLRRPRDVGALARLRRGFNEACNTLSRAAETTGLTFCCPQDDR